MKTGVYISGAGHVLLFLWIVIGGFFVAREPFEAVTITDVSIITEEEFQAAQPSSPETADAPPGLEAPEVDAPAPAPAVPDEPEAPTPAPAPAPAPEPPAAPDTPPDPVEAPPPQPAPLPEIADGDPGAAEVVEDAPELAPEQAEVIADQVTEAPEPEVDTSEVAQSEVAPEAEAEPIQEEAQEETALEETTTQVVTEADETSNQAPTRSVRPGRKPTPPPAPAPQETEVAEPAEDAPTTPALQDLIEDAVTEANNASAAEPGSSQTQGPPLSRAERSALIIGVRNCWNVGALSTDALKVTVIVGVSMTPDAKPEVGSIRLISAEGGTGVAVDRAYEAARRAIIRCGSGGYGLPSEKYDRWRNIEIKFNATTREIR